MGVENLILVDALKTKQDPLKQESSAQEEQPQKVAQQCTQNAHSVDGANFPYWNKVDTFPCSYAGTFKTSFKESQNHNLFYWLFKNTQIDDPQLVLWLNGGPGSSSMGGLFTENGPLLITRTGTGKDDFSLGLKKEGSWLDIADVLYLDQPVGTGFSYGDNVTDVVDRMDDGAKEFIIFLQKFLEMYPEYKKSAGKKFYLTGESFGGKYISLFAKYIHDYAYNGKLDLELDAILLGNPLVSPPIQRQYPESVAKALGVVDDINLEQIATLKKNCDEILSKDWTKGSTGCEQAMSYIQDVGGDLWSFDGRIFGYDWTAIKTMDDFLRRSTKNNDIYKALHVDQSTKSPIYDHSSSAVAQAYDFENMLDYTYYYDEIFSNGYKLLIFAGEWDERDGPTTMEEWLRNSRFLQTSKSNFWQQARKIYYMKQQDGSYQVGGQYRYDPDNKFTFLTVPKAGHFVPTTQLDTTKSLLQDYITSGGLVCHKDKPEDCNTDGIMCKYVNNCNGHGTCQDNGQCLCDDKYKAADCSEKAEQLVSSYNKQFVTNGTQWIYFQFRQGLYQNYYHEFTLSSKFPLDVYIKASWQSDPNEFDYDIALRQQNYIRISSKQFPTLETFVAAIKINGIEHYNTIFHVNTLQAKFDVKVDPNIPASSNEKNHNQPLILEETQDITENGTLETEGTNEGKEQDEWHNHKKDGKNNHGFRGHHKQRGGHRNWLSRQIQKINFGFQHFIIGLIVLIFGGLYLMKRNAKKVASQQAKAETKI